MRSGNIRRTRPDRRYHDRRDDESGERRKEPVEGKPFKALVTGDRDWTDVTTIVNELSKLPPGSIVVHGACRGVDIIAHAVAETLGFTVRSYPADWDGLGLCAGPIRNQQMLDEEHKDEEPINICLAFHDDLARSKGTKDMVERASDAEIEVKVYRSCASGQQDDSGTRGTPSS